ncbi:MAG: tetratricopeptide repeat protein [archaeon]|nr:tetratricopeptide repeat protein [archaeon]
MDGETPILTKHNDIKIWRQLIALESAAIKGHKKNADKFRKIMTSVEKVVNPKIACKIIDLINLYFPSEAKKIFIELLSKCSSTSSAPYLKVSGKLIEMKEYDSAKLILDKMTVISDVSLWEYYRGLVDISENNTLSAKSHFIRCHSFDDRFMPVYQELETIEPRCGWKYRKMIADVMNGDVHDLSFSTGEGRFCELYNAYYEWRNGSRSNAKMNLKKMIREGMECDIDLAIARITASENNYSQATIYYSKACENKNFSILMETARVHLLAGEYEKSLVICKRLEDRCICDRRLLELMIEVEVALVDRSGLMRYINTYLCSDYADFGAYVKSISALIQLQMHSEASSLISKVREMESKNPILDLLSSKNDYASERYVSARVFARKAIKKMPHDVDCLIHTSKIYMKLNQIDKSLKYIDDILVEHPHNRDALALKKDALKLKNPPDYDGALAVCQNIINLYQNDAEIVKDSAIIYEKMGKDREALDAYRHALSIKRDATLFMQIITSLVKNVRYKDAVEIITGCVNIYGDLADMWVIKGNAEYAIEKYHDAIESYTKAIELNHNNPIVWYSKGMAEEKVEDYEAAEISYDRAVLMDLDNPVYWISKAAVEEKIGEFSEAIKSLNRVILLYPDNVYSLMRKANILLRLGRPSEARIIAELSSKIEPLNLDIMAALRNLYFIEGDTEATKTVCKNILSFTPDDRRTTIIYAKAHIKANNLDEAIGILANLNIGKDKLSDEDYEILDMMRSIYHAQGKFDEEVSICKTILDFRPEDISTKNFLAEAYVKLQSYDMAKKIYDELRQSGNVNYLMKKAEISENSIKTRATLTESLSINPNDKMVLQHLSKMMLNDGMLEESLEYANKAIGVDQSDSDSYILKISALMAMDNHSAVLDVVEEVKSNIEHFNPIIWKFNADSHMILGDYSDALVSYETAIKLGVQTSETYRLCGMCQEVTGMDDIALDSYTSAYQMDNTDTFSMVRVAAIFLKRNEEQSAEKILEQVMEVDPTHSEAIIAMATIFASKENKAGLSQILNQCIHNNVDSRVKQTVTELLNMANSKETVAMPVLPLVMPKPTFTGKFDKKPIEATNEKEIKNVSETTIESQSMTKQPTENELITVTSDRHNISNIEESTRTSSIKAKIKTEIQVQEPEK